jgi:hypothetical protein
MKVAEMMALLQRYPLDAEMPDWLFARELPIKEDRVEECKSDIAGNPGCGCFFDDRTLVMADCGIHDATFVNPDYVDLEEV